jgi:hypothetical protein
MGDVVVRDGVDLNDRVAAGVNSALVLLITVAPLLSVDLVAPMCNTARKALPIVGAAIAGATQSLAKACHTLRSQRQMLFMLLHGGLTYATGDMIAQAALSGMGRSKGDDSATLSGTRDTPRKKSVSLRPLRVARAALVGVLSDTLPFYYWSVALESVDPVALARRFPIFERKPSMLVASKVGVHLATFQPATSAAYLFLQPLLRGQSLVASLAFMRRKFMAAFLPAFSSFLLGGPIVYSLPSIILQGALRNLGVLGISVYLAVVSSS